MKKLIVTGLSAALLSLTAMGQEKSEEAKPVEGFQFTPVKENPITPVKNQNRSSTCWSFSSLGFFEAELLRMGQGETDLSEMFVVHKTMEDRAERYLRLQGEGSFAPGGSFYDAVYAIENYGIVPQDAMPGILYDDSLPMHNELDAVAGACVNALTQGKRLSSVWKNVLCGIYDAYLGVCPEQFTYQGKTYTPKSYAESLGLNMDDYVSLTSFTHHPFYTRFAIEIPDNWRQALSYNLPLEELMEVMRHAVKEGYTFGWASDVSEPGFTRQGIGVVVDTYKAVENTGSDMVRWLGMAPNDRAKALTDKPYPQMEITQEMRQTAFDNWETTDDHGMLIYGMAQDQYGTPYFMVKNSWGTKSTYKGIWYVSEAFAAYKTINILVHKDAVPKEIRRKLGLK